VQKQKLAAAFQDCKALLSFGTVMQCKSRVFPVSSNGPREESLGFRAASDYCKCGDIPGGVVLEYQCVRERASEGSKRRVAMRRGKILEAK
jgi:hypothetical protein